MNGVLEGREFRRILGHYPTGVCAVTALGESGPVGMIVGSFTSVSLDPPLVAFLPDRASTRWPRIAAAGHFCVNVLAEGQQSVCKALSSKADDKFETISYRLSETGLPIIDGAVAWIDCQLQATHEAGDHYIAIGLVRALDVEHSGSPLVFSAWRVWNVCALPARGRGGWTTGTGAAAVTPDTPHIPRAFRAGSGLRTMAVLPFGTRSSPVAVDLNGQGRPRPMRLAGESGTS